MIEYQEHRLIGSSLDDAVVYLKDGGIVAFPTETYYGLAVDPDSKIAVANLFKLKKRQKHRPLLVLIENREQLYDLVEKIPNEYLPLMEKYWPGPLTLVFPAQKRVNKLLTGNTGTIGVRISSNPFAQALVRKMGKPITATSANFSGASPASIAAQVLVMFNYGLSYILDGGRTPGGLCSTVLGQDQKGNCIIFRQGQIDLSNDLVR